MNKQIIGTILKYLLAVGLLAYVVYANWAPEGGKGLAYVCERHFVQGQPIHWLFLAGGFFIYLFAVVITLIRWYFLVRAQDLPFTLPDAIRIGFVGIFFNTFLPGSVGGDIIKAAALARQQERRTVAVATVIMDRVIALWGLAWFVTILGTLFWLVGGLEGAGSERSKYVVSLAGTTVAVSMLVWLLLGLLSDFRAERFAGRLGRIPRVGGSAAELWRAVWMYRKRQGIVFGVLAMSWVGHVGFVLAYYCCVLTLWDGNEGNAIPTLAQHFLIVPIGLVIQAIPLFPGGAGIGELGFGLLYDWFGYAKSNGVLGSLVQRVVTWLIGLLGYLIYLRMRSRMPATKQPEQMPQPEKVRANGFYAKKSEGVMR